MSDNYNLEYKDFVTCTGYGTGGGLCGWNCRHNLIPFNPENMTNDLKQYGLEENKEMYENHQKQRCFERNIRKYKRLARLEKKALEGIADENEAKKIKAKYLRHEKLAKKWTEKYKSVSKQENLRIQPERLKI